MKVLLVNGSPHQNGCTAAALAEVASALRGEGIASDFFWIGTEPIGGCLGCFKCRQIKKCAFGGKVNEFVELAAVCDGFIFGSPVYYAGVNGAMTSFMDRVFFSAAEIRPHPFRFKPAAAVVSARRGGAASALDQMNKYFLPQQMPIVSSCSWNMVHGNFPDEVQRDREGLQVMRTLGRNMAWLLKLKEAGEKAGISPPRQDEVRLVTNFIR